MLAIRKKSLENRLLATREILKLQNEHIIGTGGGGVGGGEIGSPLLKTKPISFSQAMKMVSAQINTKRSSGGSFHNIVDQYVAKKREEQQGGMSSSMATPTKMTGGVVSSGGVGRASSPLLTSAHMLGSGGSGSGAVGRSRKHGICLQGPRRSCALGGQSEYFLTSSCLA